ncbi:MAG: SpoVA/SpoVAEb family sporulation membrane protein [Lachnospiraceae bacterium]|nr:SpoVA/SpoVAEb family sporulation membrane protein [Lachnospiraceae bacterium]
MEEQTKKERYAKLVKERTPVHNLWKNVFRAFWTGGAICLLGEVISGLFEHTGMGKENVGASTSLILIALSVVLTAFGWYAKLARYAGAGVLVPITGFANSIAASAIEYQVEGQVFGIGCQIFKIAGPVILYGIFYSWLLGVFYWIGTLLF